MPSVESFREFINERLTAAAEEIIGVFEQTVVQYEEEINRQQRLLDIICKPELKIHRIELPQQQVFKEEEEEDDYDDEEEDVLSEQQLFNKERSSCLDQEFPQIKEEQEDLCISQDRKQETDGTYMVTYTYDESEDQTQYPDETQSATDEESVDNISVKSSEEPELNPDHHLLSKNPDLCESQDHRGGSFGDSESTENTEKKLQKTHYTNKNHSNSALISAIPKVPLNSHAGQKSLQCETCGKVFKFKSRLITHLRIHSGVKPYSCNICGKSFNQTSTLNAHTKIHTDERPYSCKTCGKCFRTRSTLFVHMRRHTDLPQQHVYKEEGEKVFSEQQLCNQDRTSSLEQVDPEPSHIKEEHEELCSQDGEQLVLKQEDDSFTMTFTYDGDDHSEDETLYPNAEETESTTDEESTDNISVISSELPEPNTDHQLLSNSSDLSEGQGHRGGQCGDKESTGNAETSSQGTYHTNKFDSNSVLNSTMSDMLNNAHTGQKSYKCGTCGKDFKFKSKLIPHLRTHTGVKPYSCNICGQRFTRTSTLKAHKRIHTGERPYSCKICGKGLRTSSGLLVHVRTHTGEKPYTCNTCGSTFTNKSILRGHMRTHTGEKPYSCNTCGRRFGQLSHLKRHTIVHTGERPYSCDICGMDFRAQADLSSHMRTHTGKRRYQCDTCGKDFKYPCDFSAHMRSHTGDRPYVCGTCGKGFRYSSNLAAHMKTHIEVVTV